VRRSLAVVLAGCFSKPPPPCTKAIPLAFDVVADDCLPWGTAFNNGTFHQGNGVLTIAPAASSSGYCNSNTSTPFGEGGVFVEVEPAVGAGAGTSFSVGVTGQYNPQLGVQDGMITYDQVDLPNQIIARAPYVHDAMRWWRFVPDLTTHAVIAQTAPDGSSWTELGRAEASDLPDALKDLTEVDFELFVAGGDPPGQAEFRSFDICPD
jgi:hypothetical protein